MATAEPSRVDAGELLRRLEEGVKGVMSSDGWRRFLTTQAKFHNYTADNLLLILMQNPQAKEKAEPERTTPVRFRVAYVFDIAQTDGKPLPEAPVHRLTGSSAEARVLVAHLTRLVEQEGLELHYADPKTMPRGANGYYQPMEGRIVVSNALAPD